MCFVCGLVIKVIWFVGLVDVCFIRRVLRRWGRGFGIFFLVCRLWRVLLLLHRCGGCSFWWWFASRRVLVRRLGLLRLGGVIRLFYWRVLAGIVGGVEWVRWFRWVVWWWGWVCFVLLLVVWKGGRLLLGGNWGFFVVSLVFFMGWWGFWVLLLLLLLCWLCLLGYEW